MSEIDYTDKEQVATLAREMGHVPKDKWTGPEDKWVDAETFVKRGEHILPIVLKDKRELQAKNAELVQQMAALQEDVKGFKTHVEKAAQAQVTALEAQLARVRADKAEAITAQDGAGAVAADAEIERLTKEKADAVKAATPAATSSNEPAIHPAWKGWVAKNGWYDDDSPDFDEDLQTEANILYAKELRKGAKPSPEVWNRVAAAIRKRNPEKFGDTSQRGNTVEGDTDTDRSDNVRTRGNGKAHTYENLPPDAKRACDGYIERGWFNDLKGPDGKPLNKTQLRERYALEYDWS
jgi:predicted phage tail protein